MAFYSSFLRQIIEATRIDGASEITIFRKIVVPLSKAAMATIVIVNFPFIWNEFVFALVVNSEDAMKTLPVGLLNFRGQWATRWDYLMAGIGISCLPLIIIYLVFQNQIRRGVTLGSIKA